VSTPGLILKVVHGLVPLICQDYNTRGVIQSKMNKKRHLSLSGDVRYSLRFSCKTLEARVVEILSSASYFGLPGLSLASESDCLHWTCNVFSYYQENLT
jgi:hypothetical protein